MKKPDLTTNQTINLRTASNSDQDKTNAFGTSIIVDGVPMSNNANISSPIGGTSSAGLNVDLRQVSTDNIESVEIIRGIPSAEYGDLTSGAVIVKSKSGRTPFEVRSKINPEIIDVSVGKGFDLGKKNGTLNTSFDYAKAWGDPRKKDESFDRYNFSLNYAKSFSKIWRTNTKFSYSSILDWGGRDPDAIQDGTESTQDVKNIKISHDGKLAFNLPFMRTLSYVVGFNFGVNDSHKTRIVPNSDGNLPIITSMQTGYFEVPYMTTSYSGSGGVKSRPKDVFLKLSNSFGFNVMKQWAHQIGMGIEYRHEQNKAQGYYNDDETKPLNPSEDGRPRPYYDIPPLNQLSAYLEDKMTWKTFGKKTNLNIGLRYSSFQPFKEEQVWAISPRINASIELTKAFELRAGFGQNAKTPGMTHLYPEKKYIDRVSVNTIASADPAEREYIYHTMVYDVKRSEGLKNAVETKYELGFDIKLPENRTISVMGYYQKTPNGFGSKTSYFTYLANYYDENHGLTYNAGAKPTLDPTKARVDTVFGSKGEYGNNQWALSKGLEIDANLGRWNAINSSFYVSGAYSESQSKTTGLSQANPQSLHSPYVDAEIPPFKYIYNAVDIPTIYRSINTTFRIVTNIPALRMVMSNAVYVTWYQYSKEPNYVNVPIGYITANTTGGVDATMFTEAMYNDPNYKIKGYSIADGILDASNNIGTTLPSIWNLSTRLTKEISNVAGFSFFVNNTLFYEPWKKTSLTQTLSQKNTGSFSFGIELFLKL